MSYMIQAIIELMDIVRKKFSLLDLVDNNFIHKG